MRSFLREGLEALDVLGLIVIGLLNGLDLLALILALGLGILDHLLPAIYHYCCCILNSLDPILKVLMSSPGHTF